MRIILRAATAGVLALAVALSGPAAWAQETEPPTAGTTTTPTTQTGTPAETGVEPPAGRPAETPAEQEEEPWAEQGIEPQAVPPATRPDLQAAVAFDQTVYAPDSDIGVTVTVRNVGNAPAVDVRSVDSGSLWFKSGGAELRAIPGPTLAPGESKTFQLVARAIDQRADTVSVNVQFHTGLQHYPSTDPTPGDNHASASASVTQGRGSADGLVYRDGNGNGTFDEGEGVAYLYVYATGGTPYAFLSGRTDATGRFSFGGDIPTGTYRAYVQNYPNPYVIAAGRTGFTIQAGVATRLDFSLTAPVSEVLRPHLELDKDSYLPTDQVNIKITLTNSGPTALTGVVAVCDESWSDGSLNGRSPAWAELSPEGPGIPLAAGETKVLTVTETVTEDARLAGRISVACVFGNSGRSSAGYIGWSDSAEVGAFGAVEGTLKLDSGDGGQPLDGARLVALNQRTALRFAEAVSHDGGSFTFGRLPQGATKVLVLGDYQDKATGNGWFTVTVADGTTRVEFVAVPGPSVHEPAAHDKLEVTASFDKASYTVDEQVTAKVKITHAGAGYRTGVRFEREYSSSNLVHPVEQWGPLYRPTTQPLYLWPGESYEVTLIGHAPLWSGDGVVRVKGRITGGYDLSVPLDLSAAVTYPKGDATVLAFADTNANGVLDAAEEPLADVKVSLSGGLSGTGWHSGVTDAAGRFRVEDIGIGNYSVHTTHEDGWIQAEGSYVVLTVTPDGDTVFEEGLVRPISDGIKAKLAFDQESYLPTDPPKLKVKITNNTGGALTFGAHCGGYGWAHEILNGEEWGPLAWDGPGVPIADGDTWTGTVVETMPEASPDHGVITASCAFGPRSAGGDIVNGAPFAGARAKVPGATWTTTGRVEVAGSYPRQPVANTELVLLDLDTELPVARTTTDEDGRFTFPDLPVGHYTPVVVGPWQVTQVRSGPLFRAVHGNPYPELVVVVPGPEVGDPGATAPPRR